MCGIAVAPVGSGYCVYLYDGNEQRMRLFYPPKGDAIPPPSLPDAIRVAEDVWKEQFQTYDSCRKCGGVLELEGEITHDSERELIPLTPVAKNWGFYPEKVCAVCASLEKPLKEEVKVD